MCFLNKFEKSSDFSNSPAPILQSYFFYKQKYNLSKGVVQNHQHTQQQNEAAKGSNVDKALFFYIAMILNPVSSRRTTICVGFLPDS